MIIHTPQKSKLTKFMIIFYSTCSRVIASSKNMDIRRRSRHYHHSVPVKHSTYRRTPMLTDNDLINFTRPSAMKHSYTSSVPERASVDDATILWIETVTSGLLDAPERVTRLYARDAILWGTVSDEVRTTPEKILKYFEHFARVPGLRLIPESLRSCVQIYGNIALSSGYYSFSCSSKNPNGPPKIIHGRYTFVYRRLHTPREDGVVWEIVNHHSSIIPIPPSDLTNTNGCTAGSVLMIA